MADGTKTRIGRNRVNRTEPEFEEDEPATYEAASPIFVDSVDEDEYEDEPDVVEDDDDAEFVDDPGDADDEDDEDDEHDEHDGTESTSSGELIVEFAKVEDGVIRVVVRGDFTADITEGKDGAKTVYNSSEFGGSQTTLKRALEAVGRNTVMRAVGKAWTEANPKEKKKPAAPRSGTAARIDSLEAALAQSNANMAAILSLLEKKTAAQDVGADDEDDAPVRRTRIARS